MLDEFTLATDELLCNLYVTMQGHGSTCFDIKKIKYKYIKDRKRFNLLDCPESSQKKNSLDCLCYLGPQDFFSPLHTYSNFYLKI